MAARYDLYGRVEELNDRVHNAPRSGDGRAVPGGLDADLLVPLPDDDGAEFNKCSEGSTDFLNPRGFIFWRGQRRVERLLPSAVV
ncbi:hypothetical protein DEI87_02660 [Curtobacterium sp. MCBD17_029]|nr:hypothetical protein DEI87_02660 [Curtobacterium sp. MCBD17_029]PYY62027.1 hypothetical protein DEJ26_00620 [Curtobacterium sp. MCPF17_015]